MNIRDEKKKYTPPKMKIVKLHQVVNLLSSSDRSENGDVDIEDIDGYDDEFG